MDQQHGVSSATVVRAWPFIFACLFVNIGLLALQQTMRITLDAYFDEETRTTTMIVNAVAFTVPAAIWAIIGGLRPKPVVVFLAIYWLMWFAKLFGDLPTSKRDVSAYPLICLALPALGAGGLWLASRWLQAPGKALTSVQMARKLAWARYGAFLCDFFLFYSATLIALKVMGLRPGLTGVTAIYLFFFPAWEGLQLAATGQTIGKALFRIRVKMADRDKPTMYAAMSRSVMAWGGGAVMGLPILSLIGQFAAYSELTKQGTVWWDRASDTQVSAEEPQWWSWAGLMLLVFACAAALVLAGYHPPG